VDVSMAIARQSRIRSAVAAAARLRWQPCPALAPDGDADIAAPSGRSSGDALRLHHTTRGAEIPRSDDGVWRSGARPDRRYMQATCITQEASALPRRLCINGRATADGAWKRSLDNR
jgi:hypothetical protein